MGDEFQELFVIEHSTDVSDELVRVIINELPGVTGVSWPASRDVVRGESTTWEPDITYDSEETDRTEIAQAIEDVDGVAEVTFG